MKIYVTQLKKRRLHVDSKKKHFRQESSVLHSLKKIANIEVVKKKCILIILNLFFFTRWWYRHGTRGDAIPGSGQHSQDVDVPARPQARHPLMCTHVYIVVLLTACNNKEFI